jgi:hypothetical protein
LCRIVPVRLHLDAIAHLRIAPVPQRRPACWGGARRLCFHTGGLVEDDTRLDPLPGFAPRTLQAGAASRAVWYSNWPDEALNDPALDVGDYG